MKNLKYFLALLLVPFALILTGCSTPTPSSTEPTSLSGDWAYSSDSTKFTGTVSGDDIEIYLTLDDSTGLYWSGTFQDEAVNGEKISSDADVAALETSLFGSLDEKKDFVFKDGALVFEFTILGVTQDIQLKK
jgi:hypothetical protein